MFMFRKPQQHKYLQLAPLRLLSSSGGDNQQKDSNNDYSKKFESLLGKTAKPISDFEKEAIEKQKAEKAKMDAMQADLDE